VREEEGGKGNWVRWMIDKGVRSGKERGKKRGGSGGGEAVVVRGR